MDTWFPTFRKLFTDGWFPTLAWPWWTTLAQQRSLLRMIAISREEKLPPEILLKQWAEDETGRQRFRLRRLVKLLDEGRSLADAVEAVPGVLRDEDLLALRFDVQSGTRTAAMRANLVDEPSSGVDDVSHFGRLRLYFATVLPISVVLILFAQIQILPKLQKIFFDFGIQPPPVMIGSVVEGPYSHLLLLGVVVALLVLLCVTFTQAGRRLRRT